MRDAPDSTALFHRPSTGLPPGTTGVCSTAPYNPQYGGTPTAAVESAAGAPTVKPANDNRPVLAWPTAKRLAKAKRVADLALLIEFKKLVDLAYGTPANDNWREPAPRRGAEDTRPAEEVADNTDRVQTEDSFLPTVDEMHTASDVPWGDDDGYDPDRPARGRVVAVDRGGVVRRELGGLAFIYGALLYEYRPSPESPWRRPSVRASHHRNRGVSSAASVPVSSGDWTLDDQIDARQELRSIHDKIPASSTRLLEIACGPTRAREIGEALRRQGKTAERLGVRLIDRAIGHLREAWRP